MHPAIKKQIETQEAAFSKLITTPPSARFTRHEINEVPVEITSPATGTVDASRAVIYLHGGGYSNGCAAWARRATARLSEALGCQVVAPDYRLAPEFPFPAQQEDTLAVFRGLQSDWGLTGERIAVAGDSAGGALAVTLAADARDAEEVMPGVAIANSLWADIALNTPSLDDPVRNRYDVRRELVEYLSQTLLSTPGVQPMDGRHSPVYRDLSGLPPLLLQAAGRDACHDDSVRLAANARAAGVTTTLTEYADVEHIWILNGPWRMAYADRYPEDPTIEWIDCGEEPVAAQAAIGEMAAFIDRYIPRIP